MRERERIKILTFMDHQRGGSIAVDKPCCIILFVELLDRI